MGGRGRQCRSRNEDMLAAECGVVVAMDDHVIVTELCNKSI